MFELFKLKFDCAVTPPSKHSNVANKIVQTSLRVKSIYNKIITN
jgi:hypothetical protein